MYTFAQLEADLQKLNALGVEVGTVGETQLGRRIPYVFLGNKSGKCLIVQGGIHAREHITSKLVVNQALFVLKNKINLNGGIYYIPMVNADGVELSQRGIESAGDEKRKDFLLSLNKSENFELWKANINGVDLNTNFDAKWGSGKSNVFFPAPYNFVGPIAESEKETRALTNFCKKIKPDATISYHCKGEVIFWKFFQKKTNLWRDLRVAKSIARETGYQLLNDEQGSAGGFKDWCIQKLGIPAFTVEVGDDNASYPFPYSEFDKIFHQNKTTPHKLLNCLAKT